MEKPHTFFRKEVITSLRHDEESMSKSTAVELFDSNVHFLTFECVYAVEQNKVEKNVSAL